MGAWEKRGDNTYRLIAYRGYDSNGKKLSPVRVTITPPEGLSEKRLNKYLDTQAALHQAEVDKSHTIDASQITFEDFANRWLRDYANRFLERATLDTYLRFLERINKAIGHIKLDKLQPYHLTDFYISLEKEGARQDSKYVLNEQYTDLIQAQMNELVNSGFSTRRVQDIIKGKNTTSQIVQRLSKELSIPAGKLFNKLDSNNGKLSDRTIFHYHELILSILNKAVKWNVLQINPAAKAEVSRAEHKEAGHYDEPQVIKMLRLLYDEPLKYQVSIYIATYGGLRLGEVTGLEWSDIDFDEKTVSINKARQYVPKYGSYDKGPKTKSSRRTFVIADGVIEVLKEHKIEQTNVLHELGDAWHNSNKILTQWNGLPMFPDTPSKWFRNWLERVGLPKITFHQLRHTCATLLIANGVDIANVSKQLGHADIVTTLNMYTHAVESKKTLAANTMDKIITRKTKQRMHESIVSSPVEPI